jgi:GntR family transcriptional regulator, histidine utilization repressor
VTVPSIRNWQAVQDEVRRRIAARVWSPGDFIPHEAELAREFGCARATVNRALRELADEGMLDRRRKAGTRVAVNPVRRARFAIPVIRDEIEAQGRACRHAILTREMRVPPPDIGARMQLQPGNRALHVRTLYTADGAPYVLEDRWINATAVPAALAETFASVSPNEWLVREVPFEGGDFAFSAITSTREEAAALSCEPGVGLFVLDRTTWSGGSVITSVRLVFHPGYRMHTRL